MPKIEIPDEFVQKIMMENGMDPHAFCVILRDETTIVLRNYKTRDDITIHQGDKTWNARKIKSGTPQPTKVQGTAH